MLLVFILIFAFQQFAICADGEQCNLQNLASCSRLGEFQLALKFASDLEKYEGIVVQTTCTNQYITLIEEKFDSAFKKAYRYAVMRFNDPNHSYDELVGKLFAALIRNDYYVPREYVTQLLERNPQNNELSQMLLTSDAPSQYDNFILSFFKMVKLVKNICVNPLEFMLFCAQDCAVINPNVVSGFLERPIENGGFSPTTPLLNLTAVSSELFFISRPSG